MIIKRQGHVGNLWRIPTVNDFSVFETRILVYPLDNSLLKFSPSCFRWKRNTSICWLFTSRITGCRWPCGCWCLLRHLCWDKSRFFIRHLLRYLCRRCWKLKKRGNRITNRQTVDEKRISRGVDEVSWYYRFRWPRFCWLQQERDHLLFFWKSRGVICRQCGRYNHQDCFFRRNRLECAQPWWSRLWFRMKLQVYPNWQCHVCARFGM